MSFCRSNLMQRLFVKYLVFSFNLIVVIIKVMTVANDDTWERSCVCFVDSGLEALQCQVV